ncbi:MAG: sialidase family protein [Chloroflexota bacterium]|nr:sialidase family protein [Chloroflexota bacterium]
MPKQVTVYREPGRFAGWPANYGMWAWGDEIVVGFTLGYHKTVERGHARDRSLPFVNMQARSLDGGLSWQIEDFNGRRPDGRGLSADEHMDEGLRLAEVMDAHTAAVPSQPLRFGQPDFALMVARTGLGRGVFSFFYLSSDRCRSWQGPYRLPMFAQTGIAARSDYLIQGERKALFFLTANKADGEEGKIICVRTEDGGQSFALLSQVGDESGELSGRGDFAIMPASLQLPGGRILCASRCREGASGNSWIDLRASDDGGRSWQYLNQPARFHEPGHSGNPPALHRLPDGRLVLIYGNRDQPCAIAARLSADEGATWSDEIVLRAGSANGDMGYVRAVVLDDGAVVAAYYINDRPDGDGERFIEAAIWQP